MQSVDVPIQLNICIFLSILSSFPSFDSRWLFDLQKNQNCFVFNAAYYKVTGYYLINVFTVLTKFNSEVSHLSI